jgi:hypothetical protein
MQLWRRRKEKFSTTFFFSFHFHFNSSIFYIRAWRAILLLILTSIVSLCNQQSRRQQCENKEKKEKKWEKLQSHDIYRAIDVELFLPYDFMCYDLVSLARWGYWKKIRSKDVIIINLHDFFCVSVGTDWRKWNASKGHKCL